MRKKKPLTLNISIEIFVIVECLLKTLSNRKLYTSLKIESAELHNWNIS